MLGLGEQRLEVHQVMDDMRSADIDFMTIGQYLQPTPKHATVEDYVTPDTFAAYAAIARIDWPGGFHRTDIGWRALQPR